MHHGYRNHCFPDLVFGDSQEATWLNALVTGGNNLDIRQCSPTFAISITTNCVCDVGKEGAKYSCVDRKFAFRS